MRVHRRGYTLFFVHFLSFLGGVFYLSSRATPPPSACPASLEVCVFACFFLIRAVFFCILLSFSLSFFLLRVRFRLAWRSRSVSSLMPYFSFSVSVTINIKIMLSPRFRFRAANKSTWYPTGTYAHPAFIFSCLSEVRVYDLFQLQHGMYYFSDFFPPPSRVSGITQHSTPEILEHVLPVTTDCIAGDELMQEQQPPENVDTTGRAKSRESLSINRAKGKPTTKQQQKRKHESKEKERGAWGPQKTPQGLYAQCLSVP